MTPNVIINQITKYSEKYSEKIIEWLITSGLRVVFIAVGAFLFYKIIIKIIEKAVRITVHPDKHPHGDSEEKRERTLIQIFRTTSKISIILVSMLMIFSEFGIQIAPIIAAAGIVGLALGFGGQYLIKDIISGLFIILENQYRIGDLVQFDNLGGSVEEISLRKTTLRDINGTVHHIPHGEIKTVSNLSKDYARVNLDVGVAYDTDLEHVIEIINKIGNEIAQEPRWKDAIITPPQFLRVNDFTDSAIMLKILGETNAEKQFEVTGELRKRIKITFDKEKIVIPFPQLVVHQAPVVSEK